MTSKAAVFAANFVALYIAHQWADHVGQSHGDATHKQDPDAGGAQACMRHVATYTAYTATTTALVNKGLGIRVSLRGWLAGQAVSAITHYFADRGMTEGRPFRRVVTSLGKETFVDTYGVVRAEGAGVDLGGPGTASYVIDQAWHTVWLGVAAFLTAATSRD